MAQQLHPVDWDRGGRPVEIIAMLLNFGELSRSSWVQSAGVKTFHGLGLNKITMQNHFIIRLRIRRIVLKVNGNATKC